MTPPADGQATQAQLDLRGVRCPLNWARAKVHLETLPAGAVVALLIDDPKGARDIPRAAEIEGYAVLAVEPGPPLWRLVIQKEEIDTAGGECWKIPGIGEFRTFPA